MWRPFDSPAKKRKRFIEKNSPYLVPLAVGALAATGDSKATTHQKIKRGLVTGGQTYAAMKTAGIFMNDKSKKNYFKNTILPGVQQARGVVNTGLNIKKDIAGGLMNKVKAQRWNKKHGLDVARNLRAATRFDDWKKKNGI